MLILAVGCLLGWIASMLLMFTATTDYHTFIETGEHLADAAYFNPVFWVFQILGLVFTFMLIGIIYDCHRRKCVDEAAAAYCGVVMYFGVMLLAMFF